MSNKESLRERMRQRAAMTAKENAEIYEISEWDLSVELRSMSIGERYSLFGDDAEMDEEGGIKLKPQDIAAMIPELVIATCYDPETDERVFTDDDKEWIADQSAGVIEGIANAGMRVSGLSEDAVEAKKDGSS